MHSEGVRVIKEGVPYKRPEAEPASVNLPDKLNVDDGEELMKIFARSGTTGQTDDALGNAVILEGAGIPAPMFQRDDASIEVRVEDDRAYITENDQVLATGRFYTPHRPWDDETLSNGLPIQAALPGMSSSIVNILISLSCNNYNTGKGCRYCGLFSNPVSTRINQLPLETLKVWAKYQAEALKILTSHGWRGTLAISGGALPPSQRGEYLDRLEISLSAIREALDEETFGKLNVVYNHYPPEDFSDMHKWKEMGVNGTSIDMEVASEESFPKICPGKNAYKPQSYWKAAQEASVDVFGPLLHTTTNIVAGIEPMDALVESIDERLSKGVLVIPLTFIPDPASAMADEKTPDAMWQVEAAERIADVYIRHGFKFASAIASEVVPVLINKYFRRSGVRGKRGSSRMGGRAIQTTHLTVVFDEVLRRVQKIPGVMSRLNLKVA